MSRALTLGNGRILVCLDERGQLRDLYYPCVGLENHVGYECVHRLGVWVDGEFTWLDDPVWQVELGYRDRGMLSAVTAQHPKKDIKLDLTDGVLADRDALLRCIRVENHSGKHRQVKLFLHQQFRINNNNRGDTAYFEPEDNLIVHYQGGRVFAICAQVNGAPFHEYTVGNFGIEDKEGAWKDAEDGALEGCAVEHGPVDSVVALACDLGAGDKAVCDYWLAIGRGFGEAYDLSRWIRQKNPAKLLAKEKEGWNKRLAKAGIDFADLEDELIGLYYTSLLVLHTHTGASGEIIASGDSGMFEFGKDTYAYVWTRDASFIVQALEGAGFTDVTRSYYRFLAKAISDRGYFYHKYLPDGEVGSSWHAWVADGQKRLAIQEEETALPIYDLWQFFQRTGDKNLLAELYDPVVKQAADFMRHYRSQETGLPLPSFDAWEQDYAASTFGCSTVYAGLDSAGRIAETLGKPKQAKGFRSAAEEVRQAIARYLYNPDKQFFYKSLHETKDGPVFDDRVDMSSFYGVYNFGVMDRDDERLVRAYDMAVARLHAQTPVGGTARYEGDEFFRVSPEAPANPWFNMTCWQAQYEVARARSLDDLANTKEALWWVHDHATPAGLLSEQVRSDTGEQVSCSPLAWSHAEYVSLVLAYTNRFKELKD